MKMLSGSCLCGTVKYRVPDEFEYMGNCHCTECRKFSGSDYASVGGLDSSRFKIVSGAEAITYYAKTAATDVGFCSVCGSSLFSRKNKTGKHNIRLGTLDDVPGNAPTFHIHTGSKAAWTEIRDDLPQFTEGPPPR